MWSSLLYSKELTHTVIKAEWGNLLAMGPISADVVRDAMQLYRRNSPLKLVIHHSLLSKDNSLLESTA
jgi:hypothetical protein